MKNGKRDGGKSIQKVDMILQKDTQRKRNKLRKRPRKDLIISRKT